MTIDEYIEYIRNPLAEAKPRVVIIPHGESLTTLHRFSKERGGIELRISELISGDAWLPMPGEIFEKLQDIAKEKALTGEPLIILGLPGYLALLTDENKRATIIALREWVDSAAGREAICILQNDDDILLIVKEVFINPRYRIGKQLVTIKADRTDSKFETVRMQVMLVGASLAPLIPEECDTFQSYLRYTEGGQNDGFVKRIVVTSEQRLSGLNVEVQQLISLRDFARGIYGVEDEGLSEDALRWICSRAKKEAAGSTLPKMLKLLFFPEGELVKRVLCVFDEHVGIEREVAFWLIKQLAPKGKYLDYVLRQDGISVDNFRSAYVLCAAECLDSAREFADERRDAIREARVKISDADIRMFVTRCAQESTSRVAPWLNCETDAEHAELLRRCAADGIVTSAVKSVYPEAAAYLNETLVFDELTLDEYFTDYRELKMGARVTPEFYEKAWRMEPPSSVQYRDAMLQQHVTDEGCALLVVDAMGAEWLPMLIELARERNLGVESAAVGKANLPTTTQFNNIHWPSPDRRLPDIKRFDNIAHNGVEMHETRQAEENLAAALDVIGSEVIPRVAAGLTQFERVLVTADHGSSRLAVLARQAEPMLAKTLPCEAGVEIANWRYYERAAQSNKCPSELVETLDGRHWVVRGYDRLPKRGGGQGFELHGGATLEERLVPVVIFSKKGQYVPKARIGRERVQIVEKDDFDL